jgi:hypothetical protein
VVIAGLSVGALLSCTSRADAAKPFEDRLHAFAAAEQAHDEATVQSLTLDTIAVHQVRLLQTQPEWLAAVAEAHIKGIPRQIADTAFTDFRIRHQFYRTTLHVRFVRVGETWKIARLEAEPL